MASRRQGSSESVSNARRQAPSRRGVCRSTEAIQSRWPDPSGDAAAAGENAARAYQEALSHGLTGINLPKGEFPDQSAEAAEAARRSTEAFISNLQAGLRQAESAVQSSVQRMMQMLNFSASPSITPKIAPAPAASGARPMRGTAPAAMPSATRTAARGLYADYDNGGDLDWV
jgi:hypothetical protein